MSALGRQKESSTEVAMGDLTQADARAIAVAVVNELFLRLGINLDDHGDIKSLQADFSYMRQARKGAEDIARIVRKSAISVAIGATAFAIWQGVVHLAAYGGGK